MWKPDKQMESRYQCAVCGNTKTQVHIIYSCPLVHNLWKTVSNNVARQITLSDIHFGVNFDRITNNLIAQIAFSIQKYWLIRTNEKNIPSQEDLITLIVNDLKYKSIIMECTKEHAISSIYKNASIWLRPNR